MASASGEARTGCAPSDTRSTPWPTVRRMRATMSGPMLRDLLERRFQLKAHIETEQIPAFALTVAPGGLKMKEGTCTPPDPSRSPRWWGPNVDEGYGEPQPGGSATRRDHRLSVRFCRYDQRPQPALCRRRGGRPCAWRRSWHAGHQPNWHPGYGPLQLRARIRTRREAAGPLARALLAANEPSNIPRAPDLFTALEQQLGLKLEPARAPREFIVIDQVERPSPD